LNLLDWTGALNSGLGGASLPFVPSPQADIYRVMNYFHTEYARLQKSLYDIHSTKMGGKREKRESDVQIAEEIWMEMCETQAGVNLNVVRSFLTLNE